MAIILNDTIGNNGGSGGGGGSSTATITNFEGVTGTTLDTHLTLGNAVMIFKNGNGPLEEGVDNDYTISGSTITFATALVSTDKIVVVNGIVSAVDITNTFLSKGLLQESITNVSSSSGALDLVLNAEKSIYKVAPTEDFTFSIDVSSITIPQNTATTFYLLADMTDGTYTITWDNSIQWGNTSPTMTAQAKYLLAFTSFDGGINWIANQMYSWL